MFGQIRPIVVDEQHVILAGNGLYDTMLTLGRETADCFIVTGLSENEKKKLVLADNRIFSLGTDDLSAFDAMVNDLKDDLDIPGFDDDLLQSLIANGAMVFQQISAAETVEDYAARHVQERNSRQVEEVIEDDFDVAAAIVEITAPVAKQTLPMQTMMVRERRYHRSEPLSAQTEWDRDRGRHLRCFARKG